MNESAIQNILDQVTSAMSKLVVPRMHSSLIFKLPEFFKIAQFLKVIKQFKYFRMSSGSSIKSLSTRLNHLLRKGPVDIYSKLALLFHELARQESPFGNMRRNPTYISKLLNYCRS